MPPSMFTFYNRLISGESTWRHFRGINFEIIGEFFFSRDRERKFKTFSLASWVAHGDSGISACIIFNN